MGIDQQGLLSAVGPEPALIGEDRWYPMISLCQAFGSREVLSAFTQLHLRSQAIGASLRQHAPPATPEQAQSAAYRDAEESKQRRDLCWEATLLVFTVQPMMANELQGEIHPLPSEQDIRTTVSSEEAARDALLTRRPQ